ncbi:DUF58 domain-containing protein [Shewanella schlegeliana]|uniref:DUF58 domain-containing protein n=1 Tax=Shewanella schlegeliana TaxID=190308 RepID=A0ABS1T305_9GAMM|nr:DUF58 domain-containing protein [Shewanella schlegeliana]MBL4915181.1 DUF58 domain-containing protein [Shewanella schlegeliana]MCL1110951.1 DUF58 domain-containing protein [Shewanella schlegeliana]GIU29473.1 protein MoxR [Shewanella schlegeliana]
MNSDERIYSNFSRLSLLAKKGRGLSWRPPYSKISPLSGLQKSSQRGRGLDFVELRHYFDGDDVRCIDWRVTQRTGQAFIRLYAEEKDKSTALLIDLRSSMFFASDGMMKSVLASELAAIIAGRIQVEGDRIGALLLTDINIESHSAMRGEKSLLSLLEKITQLGGRLPAKAATEPPTLDDALYLLCQQKIKESQIFIISDFIDFDNSTSLALITQLAKHNNIIGLRVSDPLEEELPNSAVLMGDGQLQLEVSGDKGQLRQRYNQHTADHNKQLERCFLSIGQPYLALTTHQDSWQQLVAISSARRR